MRQLVGIGCDIVRVERIKKASTGRFLEKVFCECEREYFKAYSEPWAVIAGHFAAKEAMAKALGTGFSAGIGFQDIWIEHSSSGKPLGKCSQVILLRWPLLVMEVSISHETDYAIAYAMAYQA